MRALNVNVRVYIFVTLVTEPSETLPPTSEPYLLPYLTDCPLPQTSPQASPTREPVPESVIQAVSKRNGPISSPEC